MKAIVESVFVRAGIFVLAFSVTAEGGGDAGPTFIRGDCDNDGLVGGSVTDAVFHLNWAFSGGPAPECRAACDADSDGTVGNVTDAVFFLNWAFLGGPEPGEPFPECGPGGEQDLVLGCETSSESCEERPLEIEGFTFHGDNPQGYPEYRHDPTGIVFVLLPGGMFDMGSPESEVGRFGNEGPIHEVTLSPFLIAKYELTQGEWESVMGSNPSLFTGNPNRPVETVSWHEAQEFVALTGLRLPTEAQWEYACRAGQPGSFSGTGVLEEMGWFEDNVVATGGRRSTHPVGEKTANQFGLHDMHGNVFEWCEDIISVLFYSTPEAAGPDPVHTTIEDDGDIRALRGGSVDFSARLCRSANRNGNHPDTRVYDIGFRPAMPAR